MAPLTKDQIKARGKLVERYRTAIYETIWAEIENTDPALLCSDDGMPYGQQTVAGRNGGELAIEEMARNAADDAAKSLRNWLLKPNTRRSPRTNRS